MKTQQQSIGKDKAIELARSKWWQGKSPREIAKFQLFTQELTMPFDVFHKALEEALERPVWTHELGLNFDGIVMEFLGEADAPSMEDILALIPKQKLIVIEI